MSTILTPWKIFDVQSLRLQIRHLDVSKLAKASEGKDVIQGLTRSPKTLPSQYFYDDLGSQLFEQICDLPEYYPTRTEAWILQQYALAIAHHTGPCELVELGSGSSTKTRCLLDAYQQQYGVLYYQPIDVSAGILIESAKRLLADYPTLTVRGQIGTYGQALAALPPSPLPQRLLFFLGSSLGNFTPWECDRFFAQVTAVLAPGDYFLLGIDLEKDVNILEAAYNDRQGVTAAFNLNMLTHLNWRFTGNFDTRLFHHQAVFNSAESQIEMYLHCQESHRVELKGLDLNLMFSHGESIRTEISRKFNLPQMQQYLQQQGLSPLETWTDSNQWFAVILCQRKTVI
ncbi:MAG: L-histidine N(alpha)-methyltransferase [Synechococcales bacterium]|nr:L-histidine N(alpha)-methyltransferase [Synechococcales bacterium]